MNFIFCGVSGFIVLGFGLHIRLGGAKAWYLTKGVPILMPIAIRNMMIPMGIGMILMELAVSDLFPLVEQRQFVFFYVVMPVCIIGAILGVWNPRFLRPQWLVYLEDTYGPAMWVLLEDARQNAPEWIIQTETQEGLEAWAEETYQRLGLARFYDID